MEWVDRLAAELTWRPSPPTSAITCCRRPARCAPGGAEATPLAMYVVGLSVGTQLGDRKRDDAIEDAIHALLRLPEPEDD